MEDEDNSSLNISGSTPIKVSRVHNVNFTENELISKVLDHKYEEFEFKKSTREMKVEIIEKEVIEIKELK